MNRVSTRGVALVITLILLSLLMIMAVTFVALSRRERAAAATTVDQTVAREALVAGLNHACAAVFRRVQAISESATNVVLRSYAPGFFVSTNYINYRGYDPNIGWVNVTNVNFERRVDGSPLSADDFAAVVANLFYDPRVPVFVRTNGNANGPLEFRFYLDLNRNGMFEPNGYWPVLDELGNIVRDALGFPVTNYFVGDPEWIGVLERPGYPHSRTNRFVARFAYAVVPLDQTLDINFIHNQAKQRKAGLGDNDPAFYRNQGVGTWEINLAALLCDLNPLVWNPTTAPYHYETDPMSGACLGSAFIDALAIWRWRVGTVDDLVSALQFFRLADGRPIQTDFVDDYADGPRPTLVGRGLSLPVDDDRPEWPWPGADSRDAFFSMQDLFKVSGFGDRLLAIGRRDLSSASRYTFYRLMEQVGVDSVPVTNKININWPITGVGGQPTFVDWDALLFFTNTAERILRRFDRDMDFVGIGLTNMTINLDGKPIEVVNGRVYRAKDLGLTISITNIPVWPINFYTPGVHRLLQLTANILEATTNRVYPAVFAPLVTRDENNWVKVVGYIERGDYSLVHSRPVRVEMVGNAVDPNLRVYGVPVVIGSRKGFPAFNELSVMPVTVVARKLAIRRPDPVRPPTETNLMYIVGISNLVALEAWNSYATNYPRQLELRARVELESVFTNNFGLLYPTQVFKEVNVSIPAGSWSGYSQYRYDSFLVPMYFGYDVLPLSIVTRDQLLSPSRPQFRDLQSASQERWGAELGGRVWFYLFDRDLGRVIDYVALELPKLQIDISGLLTQGASTNESAAAIECWNPRPIGNSPITYGIKQQISISAGSVGSDTEWRDFNSDPVTGQDKQKAIQFFKAFLGPTNLTGQTVVQTPFNPVRKFYLLYSWQANDPMVHYTVWDLTDVRTTNAVYFVRPHSDVRNELRTIGYLNTRYEPWGGRSLTSVSPTAFDLALKDPLITCSDDWAFPTNKFPTIGWLGRVHRGTPWQTVYLKATDILQRRDGLKAWVQWTGNTIDPHLTAPVADRLIIDLFTTALNDNATRGQLSINQSALPAWSAVLSGIMVVSNSTPDADLTSLGGRANLRYTLLTVEPAAVSGGNASPLARLVAAINATRTNYPGGRFQKLGDILSVPELTERSPYLNLSTIQQRWGIPDIVYEWIPMQILSLLRCDDRRFVVFAYGQALRPAENSFVPAGPLMGLCTNYQVTAEAAAKAVYWMPGNPPNILFIQESFNWLGVDQ